MSKILIISEQELRQQISLDQDAIDCVQQSLAALAGDDVVMPPILHLAIEKYNGEVDVKTAYVPGMDYFAIKTSAGFFDNPKLGLPSLSGLMVLYSARTGQIEALLLDNGYLTDIRTAAAGGVVASFLAREDAHTAGILGGGAQARLQLEALTLVRPIKQAKVWSRRMEQAQQIAVEMSARLDIDITAVGEPRQAVDGCDIVVTTTPCREPLILAEWLSPGQHITAMGSDADYKNELEPVAIALADLYVCDRVSQCAALGELHHAIEAGVMDVAEDIPEIATIITGEVAGRTSPEAITIADLTGTGVQDTGIAVLAHSRCAQAGAGQVFES